MLMRWPVLVLGLLLAGQVFGDQVIFSDSLQSPFQDWSWGVSLNSSDGSQSRSGSKSFSFVPEYTQWGAIYFTVPDGSPDVDTSGFSDLEFYFFPTQAGQNLVLRLKSTGDSTDTTFNLTALNGVAFTPNTWTKVTLNFAAQGWAKSLKYVQLQSLEGHSATIYMDDMKLITAVATPTAPSTAAPASLPPGSGTVFTVSVDITSNRRSIDPLIYGANFPSTQGMTNVRYSIVRSGGNSASRFNWKTSVHNTAKDWFWMNIPDTVSDGATLPEGSTTDVFIDQAIAAGSSHLITLNLIGYAPLDERTKRWSYSVAKYGPQDDTERSRCQRDYSGGGACNTDCINACSWAMADAGNGLQSGNKLTATDPHDTSQTVDLASWNTEWLQHLSARGTPAQFVSLDNEPGLWHDTHYDVWGGTGVKYADLVNRTLVAAAAVKTYNPNIKITGPASWGFCEYWFSPADGCGVGADRQANNDVPLLEFYLKTLAAARSQAGGVTLVDYLDIHYYPAVPNGQNSIGLSSAEDATTVSRRFNSVKSLYNPNWSDDSWIQDVIPGYKFNLIHNFTQLIATHCPGMKLAITEYSFGNDELWSAALTTAEALAIFGREGLGMATIWEAPAAGSAVENAFKLFRNYNGAGASVDGDSVAATTSNVDTLPAYAIHDSSASKVYVIVLNKGSGPNQADVSVPAADVGASVKVYRFGPSQPLALLGTSQLDSAKTLRVPLNSWNVALLVVDLVAAPSAGGSTPPTSSPQSQQSSPSAAPTAGGSNPPTASGAPPQTQDTPSPADANTPSPSSGSVLATVGALLAILLN